jgi:hypothetical protein
MSREALLKGADGIVGAIASSKERCGKRSLESRKLGKSASDRIRQGISATYKVFLLQWNDTVLDPEAPASHHIRHHDIGNQSISDNGNFGRALNPGLWMVAEVFHYLGATARLLDLVGKNFDTCSSLDLG